LEVRGAALREVLAENEIAFVEDSSNALPVQQRNRVRAALAAHPAVTDAALEVAETCAALAAWLREESPVLGARVAVAAFEGLPVPLARQSARRWLCEQAGGDAEMA